MPGHCAVCLSCLMALPSIQVLGLLKTVYLGSVLMDITDSRF